MRDALAAGVALFVEGFEGLHGDRVFGVGGDVGFRETARQVGDLVAAEDHREEVAPRGRRDFPPAVFRVVELRAELRHDVGLVLIDFILAFVDARAWEDDVRLINDVVGIVNAVVDDIEIAVLVRRQRQAQLIADSEASLRGVNRAAIAAGDALKQFVFDGQQRRQLFAMFICRWARRGAPPPGFRFRRLLDGDRLVPIVAAAVGGNWHGSDERLNDQTTD